MSRNLSAFQDSYKLCLCLIQHATQTNKPWWVKGTGSPLRQWWTCSFHMFIQRTEACFQAKSKQDQNQDMTKFVNLTFSRNTDLLTECRGRAGYLPILQQFTWLLSSRELEVRMFSCHLSSSLPLPGQNLARQGAPGTHKAARGRWSNPISFISIPTDQQQQNCQTPSASHSSRQESWRAHGVSSAKYYIF